jgi:predicted Zn-dependent protease
MKTAFIACALLLAATPAFAQFGSAMGKINKAADQAQKVKDLQISDADERKIGEAVSAHIIDEFGVYQDKDVAKYVTLVGTVLAQASSRPNLNWEFIVLDTDAVNAFASPGGIIHVTRGVLGLAKTEAELAGILGHEITHVTEKHTTNSIQKSKAVSFTADQVGKGGLTQDLIAQFSEKAYHAILNNQFDRGDENEADHIGVQLANKVGYDPSGLTKVLTKIEERNKDQKEPNGMFASHPVVADRIQKINKAIADGKLTATAVVAARYTKAITFDAKPISALATVPEGSRGLTGGSESAAKKDDDKDDKKDEKKDEKKKGGLFGSGLSLSKGSETKSSQTVASAGARGITPDRDAVGGANKTKIPVKLTPAEITQFKSGIA